MLYELNKVKEKLNEKGCMWWGKELTGNFQENKKMLRKEVNRLRKGESKRGGYYNAK